MKSKKTIAILATSAALTGFVGCKDDISQKKQEIANILEQPKDTTIVNQENTIRESTISPSEFFKEGEDESEKNTVEVEKVSIQDLEGSPICGSKSMIVPSYGNLLGFSQAEEIMRDFNQKEVAVGSRVEKEDTIAFPLIYPELQSYFPEDLNILLTENYSPLTQYYPHFIVVSKCDNGKNALAYYQDGKLKLATYVSIGIGGKKTPEGEFFVTKDEKFRRSKKYGRSPMPYSMHIIDGVFFHQGWSNGLPQSHGCVRVPGLYQKRMYENLPVGTRISLKGLYVVTLKKQE